MTSDNHMLHSLVVGCLVYNASSDVLLIRHHKRGWEIPQGRVEEGEDLIGALHREVVEESGVEIELGPMAAVWSKLSPPCALIVTFIGRHVSGLLAPTGEIAEACWLSPGEALGRVESPVMRDRLKTLLEYRGTPVYRAYTIKPYLVQVEHDLVAGESRDGSVTS
jgi:8-oxo-dGTP diphosphatase